MAVEKLKPVLLMPSSGESDHRVGDTQEPGVASPKVARKRAPTHGRPRPKSDVKASPAGRRRAGPSSKPGEQVPVSELCAELMALQRVRRFYIKEVNRSGNACGALVRSALGWSLALPEEEREKIRKQAESALKDFSKGIIVPELAPVAEAVQGSIAAREPLEDRRALIEKKMIALAKLLPAAAWAKSVRGFGAGIAFAIIVGEAGDLSQYPTVSKLWKRLGWAPKEFYPVGENGKHMVPRRVKGELFGAVVVPLMTQNKDAYREIYLARKEAYIERGLTKNHAHKLAMRVMLKSLLGDLWGAWRGANWLKEPTLAVPPAGDSK